MNPYYEEAAAESRAWIKQYDIFDDRKRAFFFQGQSELLCSYAYPSAGYEQFRTTCDFASHPDFRICITRLIVNASRSISSLSSTKSATNKVVQVHVKLARFS